MPELEAVWRQHHSAVCGYVWRRVRNWEVAEDLTGETFLRLCESWPKLQNHAQQALLSWLYQTAYHLIVDRSRGRHYRTGHDSWEELSETGWECAAGGRGPHQMLCTKEQRRAVQQAVLELPQCWRELVVLYYFYDLEVSEVAVSLGKPEGTVKSGLFRARHLLARRLRTQLSIEFQGKARERSSL